MEPNIYDSVVDELKRRRNLVRVTLAKKFAHQKPFREEPKDPAEELYEYNQLTRAMEMELRSTMGDAPVNAYISKMEKIKERYNG